MRKGTKITIAISIIVVIGIAGMTYLPLKGRKDPQIWKTEFPYEEPLGWAMFENDFFRFQYSPALKIENVKMSVVRADLVNMFKAQYKSAINNIDFHFVTQQQEGSSTQMFFDDASGTQWQITIKNSGFPGDLQKIVDTVQLKPKQDRYRGRDSKNFANDPEIFIQDGIFDHCSPINNYKNENFYKAMIADMDLKEESGSSNLQKADFNGTIDLMCFSYAEYPRRVVLLGVSEVQPSVAVLEYDIETRTALSVVSRDKFMAMPLRFGKLQDNAIEMIGDHCYELGEPKVPCWRSLSRYDFVKKEILKVYDERYTPELGL